MAAVLLSACKVLKKVEGDYTEVMIISPSTMDSADTIDVSALVTDGQVLSVLGWDVEGGDSSTATYATTLMQLKLNMWGTLSHLR